MVCIKLLWIVKERKVYNVYTCFKEILKFRKMDYTNDYNNEMVDVEIVD